MLEHSGIYRYNCALKNYTTPALIILKVHSWIVVG